MTRSATAGSEGTNHRNNNVAIVAPSLRILGGQAVQADRLLRYWRDDPDVHGDLAAIIAITPEPASRKVKLPGLVGPGSQLSVVAGARNHLYRTAVRWP